MERTPASLAVDWSIQLEKSLRSKIPGKSIEALEEIGRQLEQWNNDPKLTFAEYKMFGLIQGEDKLFLNAIFLRLAGAFRLGNKVIKNSVVKIFLSMKRRQRDGGGILSKGKLKNYAELLSRVKEVFDKGDVEERALALLLFGCWANFSKDCADIRYIVLSCLVSDNVRQVKAALFAAGCLSELSDDFANVFLEILRTTVLSQEKPKSIKLAGGRAFGKMWCSLSLADKAYKTGLKLLMDSSEDEFSAVMLISLSRIASRWMLLIPTQIELLALFQSEERSFHVRATSLRCHRFLLGRVCNYPSEIGTVHKLFTILHRSEVEPTLQLEVLEVLYKILVLNSSIIPCVEIPELFQQLLIVVKKMLEESSIVSTRLRAVRVLADLSGKVLGRPDMASDSSLALQVISFVLDQIILLSTPKLDIHHAAELEVKSLLDTLSNLVQKHPHLCCLMLSNICLFIEKLMTMLGMGTGLANHDKIFLAVSKIIVVCLQGLEDTDSETHQVLNALKLQVENVCHCCYISSYTRVAYFLILHVKSTCTSLSLINRSLEFDKSTLDCAKKIRSYWHLYKAGKGAACQGAWLTADFIFEQLMMVVQSGPSSVWLKYLARFSNSEKQLAIVSAESDITDILVGASDTLVSAEEILASSDKGDIFCFQRWFLALRAKALKTIIDMIKISHTMSSQDATGPFINSCMEVSCRMKKLAQEYDLLLTSFRDMDRQCQTSVSALALTCSVFAFAAGFAFVVSDSSRVLKSGKFHALLIEDLVGRLGHIDSKTEENLLLLLKPFRTCNNTYFSSRYKTRISSSYEAISLHKLCQYSVGEIFSLRNEVQGDGHQLFNRVSQLLKNIISKWMLVPFRAPLFFFRVRPPLSSELILMNEDNQTLNGSSISSGHPLSLNLGFQLKNMPGDPPNKVYCILDCKTHSKTTAETGGFKWQSQLDDMVELTGELRRYATGPVGARGPRQDDDCLRVTEYVCFNLNEGGQGLSTCFLDVSCLPVGFYRIRWLSCFVDSSGSCWTLLPVNAGPLFAVV